MESCFDQSPTMEYVVSGLSPGQSYMLRVVLFERSNALAVSVRSFRVGAVSLTSELSAVRTSVHPAATREEVVLTTPSPAALVVCCGVCVWQGLGLGGRHGEVTIQTALQLAMEQHSTGRHMAAEHIYRQILEQHPNHPDALHLLGRQAILMTTARTICPPSYQSQFSAAAVSFWVPVLPVPAGLVLYQQGNPAGAIGFLERALHTNSTFEVFHNSLGECLRAVGRFGDAIAHFSRALALSPSFLPAKFNLGLAYQQLHDWSAAIRIYDEVLDHTSR